MQCLKPSEIAHLYDSRNEAIITAYATGAYCYRDIGEYFGLHLVTVVGTHGRVGFWEVSSIVGVVWGA